MDDIFPDDSAVIKSSPIPHPEYLLRKILDFPNEKLRFS